MNPETIIAQLEQINSWRRGEESEPQPNPKHVGEVIDAAVASLPLLAPAPMVAVCVPRGRCQENRGGTVDV